MDSQAVFLKRCGIFAIVALAAAMLVLPLAKTHALHSFYFDLGIFESVCNRVARSTDWRVTFASGHAHGFYLLYGWLYGLAPSAGAYILVGSQALLLVLPAVWFFRLFGAFAAFVYVAYCPLWANLLFDFHFDHLAVPFLLAFYLAVRAGRPWLSVIPALLVMGIKEPFALQAAACGLFLAWVGLRRSPAMAATWTAQRRRAFIVAGVTLATAGVVYFYLVTHYVIPFFTGGGRAGLDGGAFSWMGHSLGEMMGFLVTHPVDALWEVVSVPRKLVYLFVIFGLLAFVPLLAPVYLIPALPLLAIAMLSRLPNYYDYNTHYTAGLIIPVMWAFVHGLPKAQALWTRAWGASRLSRAFYVLLALWILGGHVMLSPSPIARLFWSEKVSSTHWRAYAASAREAMMKMAMEKNIPADPGVSVATQNTVNWRHLAHREVYLPFPWGIAEPHKAFDGSNRSWETFAQFVTTGQQPPAIAHEHYADYVVLDLKRPYFLVDRGCEWLYGECRDKAMESKFLDWVAYTRARYDAVFEQDGFAILKRR